MTTLERWFYAYRKGGLAALQPAPRSDRGHAQELTPDQRRLLLDIRQEHRSASVPLILRTLVADGRLAAGAVSQATCGGSTSSTASTACPCARAAARRRACAGRRSAPARFWQGDVCHGPALTIDGRSRPLRIHALLDDASRFIVAIEARHTERETDMLEILVRALRRHGPPDVLFLDRRHLLLNALRMDHAGFTTRVPA